MCWNRSRSTLPRWRLAGIGTGSRLGVVVLCLLFSAKSAYAAQNLNREPGWPGSTLGGLSCWGQGSGYGPFDYLSEKNKLGIVEMHHFTPEVEQLIAGKSASVGGDIDYTLRAFPNHHRALWARSRLYLRSLNSEGYEAIEQRQRSRQGGTPPECYFQRAKAFNPGDPMVSAIFGIYLHKHGKLEAALAEYQQAEKKMPDHAELAYNMGLLYLDMGNLPKAKEYAGKAKTMGYPLTGLEKRIIRIEKDISSE